MKQFSFPRFAAIVSLFCVAAEISLSAQTFTSLASFDGANGAEPYYTSLTQGTDGNLYGTTFLGGANGSGTVFSISPNGGPLTTVYSFCSQTDCSDGATPYAGVTLGLDGNLYGVTASGGAYNKGAVFQLVQGEQGWTENVLWPFTGGKDGNTPVGQLIQGSNGKFYGTTEVGGSPANSQGNGTVFEIGLDKGVWKLTTLFKFDGTDGQFPLGGVVEALNGSFYGTVSGGDPVYGGGSLFQLTGTKLAIVAGYPYGNDLDFAESTVSPILGSNGLLYGTTTNDGYENVGTIFSFDTSGDGLTLVYSFCPGAPSCTDGSNPEGGVTQGSDGNLYGTTAGGGANNDGTVFEITPAGTLTPLYSFCSQASCADGDEPFGGVTQATNGTFYGTTATGGTGGEGTVFSIATGLGAFVKTLPTFGKAGIDVIILGTDLTGTTSVTFNGKKAKFTVVSSTEITTKVPSGATTGTVVVAGSSGTLDSNMPFTVN